MSAHRATVTWTLTTAGDEFLKRRYSRVHKIACEGGIVGTERRQIQRT